MLANLRNIQHQISHVSQQYEGTETMLNAARIAIGQLIDKMNTILHRGRAQLFTIESITGKKLRRYVVNRLENMISNEKIDMNNIQTLETQICRNRQQIEKLLKQTEFTCSKIENQLQYLANEKQIIGKQLERWKSDKYEKIRIKFMYEMQKQYQVGIDDSFQNRSRLTITQEETTPIENVLFQEKMKRIQKEHDWERQKIEKKVKAIEKKMSEIYGGGTVDQSEKFVVRVDEESEEDLMAN